jgi:hypothetical protein
MGIETNFTLSRKRIHRANWVIVVPNSVLPKLHEVIGQYLIPSKAHLTMQQS